MMRASRRADGPRLPRSTAFVGVLLLIALGWWLQQGTWSTSTRDAAPQVSAAPVAGHRQALPAFLPNEAHATLAVIARGGPFPYPQDDHAFGNREGLLPSQPRGYYREYTVETPGLGHRGARRIVTGGQPPRRYYYTDDHYASFRSFEVTP